MITKTLILLIVILTSGYVRSNDWLSYRDNAISNAEVIRQFDVLIKLEEFGLQGNKKLTRWIRLAIDFDRSQCFCFDLHELDDTQRTNANVRQTRSIVAILDGKSGIIREYPSGNSGPLHSFSRSLKNLDVPDLRCVGLGRFPEGFSGEGEIKGFEAHVANRARFPDSHGVPRTESVIHNRNHVRILYTNDKAEARYDFDSKSSMPKQISFFQGPLGQRLLLDEEHFDWTERDGLFLPNLIMKSYVRKRNELGMAIDEDIKSAEVHWFSVNKALDIALLKLELTSELSSLLKLVDPLTCGADSIIK